MVRRKRIECFAEYSTFPAFSIRPWHLRTPSLSENNENCFCHWLKFLCFFKGLCASIIRNNFAMFLSLSLNWVGQLALVRFRRILQNFITCVTTPIRRLKLLNFSIFTKLPLLFSLIRRPWVFSFHQHEVLQHTTGAWIHQSLLSLVSHQLVLPDRHTTTYCPAVLSGWLL